MNVVGKKVRHNKFGEGTIVEQDSSCVSVKFVTESDPKKFMYPTCLPVRPNGTRWNIDCSATSRKIGPVSRWLILRPL